MLPAYAASKGGVVELTRSLARHDDGIEVRVLIFQRVREIAQNAAAAVGEVVATDAAVVDSVATTAMRMSFEQAQLGANVTDPLLSRRRWPNGPGTEGDRIRGKWGAPQSACYGHATGGLSAYYPGRISTVTAIFPARIFKILCGFFRPEFSYIFSDHSRLQHLWCGKLLWGWHSHKISSVAQPMTQSPYLRQYHWCDARVGAKLGCALKSWLPLLKAQTIWCPPTLVANLVRSTRQEISSRVLRQWNKPYATTTS